MEFLIVLVVLVVVVFVITGPLRRHRTAGAVPANTGPEVEPPLVIAELEAAREAKYREIRDAELDLRTGKLSEADFTAIDQTLRAEGIEILHQLDRARSSEQPPEG
jgi:hypothetical protein